MSELFVIRAVSESLADGVSSTIPSKQVPQPARCCASDAALLHPVHGEQRIAFGAAAVALSLGAHLKVLVPEVLLSLIHI